MTPRDGSAPRVRSWLLLLCAISALLPAGCSDDDYSQDAAPTVDLAVRLDGGPADLTSGPDAH
jgi:hypothetical protein